MDHKHAEDTFAVTTTNGTTERFRIAVEYETHFNQYGPNFLKVWGDDDFADGAAVLRVFNLSHVIGYGWE